MAVPPTAIKGLLWVITIIWDVITLPFYIFYQQPWKQLRDYREPKVRNFMRHSIEDLKRTHWDIEHCKLIFLN